MTSSFNRKHIRKLFPGARVAVYWEVTHADTSRSNVWWPVTILKSQLSPGRGEQQQVVVTVQYDALEGFGTSIVIVNETECIDQCDGDRLKYKVLNEDQIHDEDDLSGSISDVATCNDQDEWYMPTTNQRHQKAERMDGAARPQHSLKKNRMLEALSFRLSQLERDARKSRCSQQAPYSMQRGRLIGIWARLTNHCHAFPLTI